MINSNILIFLLILNLIIKALLLLNNKFYLINKYKKYKI